MSQLCNGISTKTLSVETVLNVSAEGSIAINMMLFGSLTCGPLSHLCQRQPQCHWLAALTLSQLALQCCSPSNVGRAYASLLTAWYDQRNLMQRH